MCFLGGSILVVRNKLNLGYFKKWIFNFKIKGEKGNGNPKILKSRKCGIARPFGVEL